ncbi:hypothetical protein FRB94_001724 [Tulasnella sp. JGI-2019a]|nr:hypothetical protein FRB94_001724 [Tulasnella sp. JGI-2019a]
MDLSWLCIAEGAFNDLDSEGLLDCLDGVPLNVMAHHGYLRAHDKTARDIREKIFDAEGRLKNVEDPRNRKTMLGVPKQITATGYSMGGALAMLDLIYLYKAIHPDLRDSTIWKLVTVGSPKLGNRGFMDYIDSMPFKIMRIINKGDPIPKLPPYQSISGYAKQAGRVLYVNRDVWTECTDDDARNHGHEKGQCPDSVDPVKNVLLGAGMKPHYDLGHVSMAVVCGRYPEYAGLQRELQGYYKDLIVDPPKSG